MAAAVVSSNSSYIKEKKKSLVSSHKNIGLIITKVLCVHTKANYSSSSSLCGAVVRDYSICMASELKDKFQRVKLRVDSLDIYAGTPCHVQ